MEKSGKHKKRSTARRLSSPSAEALRFRIPMAVTAACLFKTGEAYPVCPQCGATMNREYQRFCDRCGQRLNWLHFDRAAVISKF